MLERMMIEVKEFLDDHRYDPYEIYEDEFKDDLQGVPDPKIEPLSIIDEFLYILRNLGNYNVILLFKTFLLKCNFLVHTK